MVKIQIELSEEEDQILSIYKILVNAKNKKDALKQLILEKNKLLENLKNGT